MTQAQPQTVQHQKTLKLLLDNVDLLVHPLGPIPHPYFNDPLRSGGEGRSEIRKLYCEALVLLLEKNDRLNDRPGEVKAVRSKTPQDERTVQLIADNLAELHHPRMIIKNTYFQMRFAPNPNEVREVSKRYAEA